MSKLDRKEKWLLSVAVCAVILYGLLAGSCSVHVKTWAIKRAYKEIRQIDFRNLDDEDEDFLLGLQTKRIDVIVADEELNPVYSNRSNGQEEQVDKYIVGKQEQFLADPRPVAKEFRSLTIIRLKALQERNGENFYIVIRAELSGVKDMILYTTWFMIVVIFICAAGYFWLKRKEREKEKDREEMMEHRAQEIADAQKEFVANISHGLKTPLAVISGQVEMLECMGTDIDREYYYNSIHEEIDKMTNMVGTLLDITILDHRMEKMEMCEVDLSEMMEYMILKYDAIFEKNKIKLQTRVMPGSKVNGNRMYLEEAVNNYIMNAIQFTPQGKKIGVFLEQEGQEAVIRVYNDCSRIPEENMEDIWESFYVNQSGKYRMDAATGNAGLGLYMVKQIVKQHNGSCGAKNRENGVEFWIKIPVR